MSYPYSTFAQPELHPSRIAAVAAVKGVVAVSPSCCRYLELGCGDGGNLVPLAELLPHSSFVGVDHSSSALQVATTRAHSLGLKNISFIEADLAQYEVQRGEFDYVVCHGVYSWVAPELQSRILQTISDGVSEKGLGYVSYNVLPGWRQRGVLRDIMLFGAGLGAVHTDGLSPAEGRLKAGAQFLTFVSELRQDSSDLYGAYLKEAIGRLKHADIPYLVHEYLGEYNTPCLFTELCAQAGRVGLHYVGEARPAMMFTEDLGERIDSFVTRLGVSDTEREQALDFCRNRMFRETILYKGKMVRSATCQVESLYVASEYVPSVPWSEMPQGFELPLQNCVTGREVAVEGHDLGLVMSAIGERPSRGYSIDEVASLSGLSKESASTACSTLMKQGIVDLWYEAPPVSSAFTSADRPQVSGFARLQLQDVNNGEGASVTTGAHRTLPLDADELTLINLCDGTRSIDEVIAEAARTPPFLNSTEKDVRKSIGRLVQCGFFISIESRAPRV